MIFFHFLSITRVAQSGYLILFILDYFPQLTFPFPVYFYLSPLLLYLPHIPFSICHRVLEFPSRPRANTATPFCHIIQIPLFFSLSFHPPFPTPLPHTPKFQSLVLVILKTYFSPLPIPGHSYSPSHLLLGGSRERREHSSSTRPSPPPAHLTPTLLFPPPYPHPTPTQPLPAVCESLPWRHLVYTFYFSRRNRTLEIPPRISVYVNKWITSHSLH